MFNVWQPFALFLTCTSKISDSRFSNREEEFNLYIFELRRQINNRNSLSMQLWTQAEEHSKPGNQAATYRLPWVRHRVGCSWPPNNRATALERWKSISHTENKITGFGIRKEEMILIAWKHTFLQSKFHRLSWVKIAFKRDHGYVFKKELKRGNL